MQCLHHDRNGMCVLQWFLWASRDGSSGGRLPVVLGSTSEDAHGSSASGLGSTEEELDGKFSALVDAACR